MVAEKQNVSTVTTFNGLSEAEKPVLLKLSFVQEVSWVMTAQKNKAGKPTRFKYLEKIN